MADDAFSLGLLPAEERHETAEADHPLRPAWKQAAKLDSWALNPKLSSIGPYS
ncbi:hypothetical protein GCM10009850_112880 [Nonomuraea monospora]|uniref:Uncharacterized protein n=1 Tax=Nonomuraea monospora TaxID=568818 RepID=A0ABN3D2E7_9ACTN